MARFLLFDNPEQSLKVIPIGEKRLIKVAGQKICVVQRRDGLVAFLDECPHMSDSLNKGHLNNQNEIVCPWHTYRFNLISGEESENRCSALTFCQVEQGDDNKIYLIT